MKNLLNKLQGDRTIWMVTFFLSLISILAVYSAISTLAYKAHGNNLRFLIKHGLMIVAGFGLMYYVHRVQFKYFARLSLILIWVAAIMLVYALVFGHNLNDANRWIAIPLIGLTFQPSDFAKIVLVIYVARVLAQKRDQLHDFRNGVVPVLIPIVVICGLILPANFSTAAMLASITFLMMFLAGVPFKHMSKIFIAGFGLIVAIIVVGETTGFPTRYKTWKNRIINAMNDDSDGNYQTKLAKYAIHEGGIIPKGPGTGSSRNFLPHPYSDMIYPFIIEEYGSVLGGITLVLLYLILLFRTIKLSVNNPKMSAQLTALGLSFMLVIQAFINMAVAVSLFPTTGQPLPMVSMGGTSTLFTCLAIGIILSICRTKDETEEEHAASDQPNNQVMPA
ncbi:MAG: FtsW/RodA/SpoVE family cell cycle protein [Flavobacteriales bacterium]|nr:FtsW/RodA/SpoVE family cell cycle protein [Flavobacteriales bacterium]